MDETINTEVLADQLHDDSVVIIAHDHMMDPHSFVDMKDGGVTVKMLHMTVDVAIFDHPVKYHKSITNFEGWTREAMLTVDWILGQIENSNGAIRLVRNAQDVLDAKRDGSIGVLMGFEGGKVLEANIETLRNLWRLGVRFLQFTWAYDNQLSASMSSPEKGLTDFGKFVVQEMNRLGMLIDISHISPRAIQEIMELSTKPVVLSHGAAKRYSDNGCNLDDDQIRALADKGGVLGVHFCSHIVNDAYYPVKKQAPIDDVVRQIDYIADIGGIDVVGIGPDFFPVTTNYVTNTQADWLTYAQGLENISKMRNLTRALVARGYKEEAIRKILGGNLLRVFGEVFGG
jgi:membrane dipeptidase